MEYRMVKVTSKGQMTLPLEVRRRLKIMPGDHLAVYVEGQEIRMKRVEPFRPLADDDPIWQLVGAGESGHTDISENHDRYLAEEEVKRWHESS